MTKSAVTVKSSNPVHQAADLMRERSLKRIPVTDETGRLVGMISRLDILQALEHHTPDRIAHTPRTLRDGGSIAELMHRNIPTVSPGARLEEIVQALEASHQLRVVVVDSRRHPLGILTDGDLLTRSAQRRDAGLLARLRQLVSGATGAPKAWIESDETAVELMTRPIFTVHVDAGLMEALQLMLRHQVKRLPVVNSQGELVGLLGRANLLRGLVAAADRESTG